MMVSILKSRRRGRPPRDQRTTAISFSSAELEELAQMVAVGQTILKTRAHASPRLKAAMTRLGVSIPVGL